MLTIAVVGMGAAVGLLLFAVLGQVEERSVVRASLRQLDDYEVESVRDKELLVPLRARAIAPVLAGLTGLGKRFTPRLGPGLCEQDSPATVLRCTFGSWQRWC